MPRHTRIQGLIIQDHRILLIRGYECQTGNSFWVIPGGGPEPGETDEECVIREMNEETGLNVVVNNLVSDQEAPSNSVYKRLKTYQCTPVGGDPEPGSEPEDVNFDITAVRWFDLTDETERSIELRKNSYTYPFLQKFRQLLGYIQEK